MKQDYDDDIIIYPLGAEIDKRLHNSLEHVFEGLRSNLRMMRYHRGFVPEKYLSDKVTAINEFLRQRNLNCVVLDVSDGVDSALVLSLLVEAASATDSPIRKIVPVTMPIYCTSTTEQDEMLQRVEKLLSCFDQENSVYKKTRKEFMGKNPGLLEYHSCDLTTPFLEYWKNTPFDKNAQSSSSNEKLASMIRTPMLYYISSNYDSLGYSSIVAGSMNRDEGSYIGFFGKAADAIVDLQPIADIHKSEVYDLAEMLEIPGEFITDDGLAEKTIGAPYWFLELYLLLKDTRELLVIRNAALSPEEKKLCDTYIENIENMHRKNAHKYEVGLPSHFVDVIQRKVFGGWK